MKSLELKAFQSDLVLPQTKKKFREVSFRIKEDVLEEDATPDDIVISKQPVYGKNHTLVGYHITYRVWLPMESGKFPGELTVRFCFYPGIVGIIKIDDFIVTVEHDNFPLQAKVTALPRMYGISETEDLDMLATLLVEKEYPFLLEHIKSLKVSQLGNTLYQDPTVRQDIDVRLLIELKLTEDIKTKEQLAEFLDHRNEEMLLHSIFTVEEVKVIFKKQMGIKHTNKLTHEPGYILRDRISLVALSSYFLSNIKDF